MVAVPGALRDVTCDGTLTIGGTLLNTVSWSVGDLWRLWGQQGDYRGTDKIIPYSQGVLSYPRWRNGLRLSLPMIISGQVTTAGVAASNPMSTLAGHLATLAAVCTPPDPTTTVTRTISVLKTNGTTITGVCIPLGIVGGEVVTAIMRATLELLIPAGVLT